MRLQGLKDWDSWNSSFPSTLNIVGSLMLRLITEQPAFSLHTHESRSL
jgi:hypothetical protein